MTDKPEKPLSERGGGMSHDTREAIREALEAFEDFKKAQDARLAEMMEKK